jgi:hypothetical protein
MAIPRTAAPVISGVGERAPGAPLLRLEELDPPRASALSVLPATSRSKGWKSQLMGSIPRREVGHESERGI